jgi:hypothetical protein
MEYKLIAMRNSQKMREIRFVQVVNLIQMSMLKVNYISRNMIWVRFEYRKGLRDHLRIQNIESMNVPRNRERNDQKRAWKNFFHRL